jgi:hypothetical protein
VFGTVSAAHPTYSSGQGYCVVRWTLFMTSEGAGNAVVRAGSSVVLTIDVGNFPNIGTPGAGSGERDVAVSPPLGVMPGTTISLDLSGCEGCSTLTVTLNAASR